MADAADEILAGGSFFLGAVQPDPFTIRMDIPLSEAEFLEIVAAANASSTDTPFHVRQLERNYAHFVDLHRFVTIVLSIGRDFATPDPRRLVEPLMSSVVNWLASMSLFLDHEETDIKRRYGPSSAQWEQFKATRSAAYDGRVGYRFATVDEVPELRPALRAPTDTHTRGPTPERLTGKADSPTHVGAKSAAVNFRLGQESSTGSERDGGAVRAATIGG